MRGLRLVLHKPIATTLMRSSSKGSAFRVPALLAMLVVSAGLCSAQTISQLGIQKYTDYIQTNSNQPTSVNDYHLNVAGNVSGSLYAAITPPGGTQQSVAAAGTQYFGSYKDSAFTTPSNPSDTLPTLSNGSYSIAVGTSPTSLTASASIILTGDLYPTNVPYLKSITGGSYSWSGGSLVLNANSSYTFKIDGNDGYALNSKSANGGLEYFSIRSDTAQLFGSQKIALYGDTALSAGSIYMAAGTLAPGTYKGVIEFSIIDSMSSSNDVNTAYGGALFSAYTNSTSFTLVVVPEPGTEAALMGCVVLAAGGLQAWRRRRAATKA